MFKVFILIMTTLFLMSCDHDSVGIYSSESKNFVIGGAKASVGDYPFAANIWMYSKDYTDHLCGGSLIDKNWILTAAHCVLEDATDKSLGVVKKSELTVYLRGMKFSGSDATKYSVKTIVVHPKYEWPHYDVALIQLNESVLDITPVPLNQRPLDDSLNNTQVAAIGWGLMDTRGEKYADVLQKINLQLISRKECSDDYLVKKRNWSIGADMLCAKTNMGTTATCAGDSGGPLLQKINGRDVQIGIVSWGAACRIAFEKAPSDVEGYADVSAALSWILETIQ